MTPVLAIDPGTENSAYVVFDGDRLLACGIEDNDYLAVLCSQTEKFHDRGIRRMAIEMVASYGMPVGREVFETVYWTGVFAATFGYASVTKVYRQDVKLHLCKTSRAKDANIRQALIDRFGPGKQKAVGTKKSPGPLYGCKSHIWSALGVAVTWWDTRRV